MLHSYAVAESQASLMTNVIMASHRDRSLDAARAAEEAELELAAVQAQCDQACTAESDITAQLAREATETATQTQLLLDEFHAKNLVSAPIT